MPGGVTTTATVSNAVVVGVVNQLIPENKATELTITLENVTFKDVDNTTNKDVKTWFPQLTSENGMKAEVSEKTDTVVKVKIYGTPSKVVEGQMDIQIPSANLNGVTSNLKVTDNEEARFDITSVETPFKFTIETASLQAMVGQQEQVNHTVKVKVAGDTFKALSMSESVTSWFIDLPQGLNVALAKNVDAFSQVMEFTITGVPKETSDKYIKVSVPADRFNSQTGSDAKVTPGLITAKYSIIAQPSKTEVNVSVSGNEAKTYGDTNFELTASVAQQGTGNQTWTWSVVSHSDMFQFEGATNTNTANIKILKAGSPRVKVMYESDTTKGEEIVDLVINKKALTITSVTAVDRTYAEGDASVELRAESTNLVGKVGSDDVTIKADSKKGTIADANAGNAKAVTTQLALDGTKKDNYTLTQPTGVTVNITKAAQGKVTGLTGEAPTVSGGKGKIKDTTDKMEYSTDVNFASPAGTQCTATETVVDPGTYYVRFKGDSNHEPGAASDQVVVDPYANSPAIELSQTTELVFNSQYTGYTPQNVTITIRNRDATSETGQLTVERVGTRRDAFTVMPATIANIRAGEQATFVVAPKSGLGVGTYQADISVEGNEIAQPKMFHVKFEVKATPAPQPRDDSDDSSNDSGSSNSGSSGTVERITPNKDGKKVEPKKETPKKEEPKDSKKSESKVENKEGVVQVIPELNLTISKETAEKIEKFEDVKTDSWYNKGLSYAVERGLMNGTSEKTFAPNEKTTRSQLVEIFYRLAGQPKADKTQAFGDVSKNAYYNNAVSWASNNNIVKGLGDGNFGSNENITREQLAVFLYRFAQSQHRNVTVKTDLTKFADKTNVSPWAQDALAWAVANNLVKGVGQDSLDPKGSATRAQIATIMLRYEAMFAPKTSK